MKKKTLNAKTIIMLIVLLAGLGAGLFLITQSQETRSKAAEGGGGATCVSGDGCINANVGSSCDNGRGKCQKTGAAYGDKGQYANCSCNPVGGGDSSENNESGSNRPGIGGGAGGYTPQSGGSLPSVDRGRLQSILEQIKANIGSRRPAPRR